VFTQPLRTGLLPHLVVAVAIVVLSLLSPIVQAKDEADDPEVPVPKLFILSFNRWGDLSNPAERDLAMRELAADPAIERIIIFSYGLRRSPWWRSSLPVCKQNRRP
jgi:hypothetical protein